MEIKKITVFGSRDLSYSIIDALFTSPDEDTRPQYDISILTYPSQVPHLPPHVPSNAVLHKTSDFSSSSLEFVFAGQDLIISTISGGDYDLQVRMIDAAIAVGVRRFMPHEFGQDSMNTGVQERIPPNAVRARLVDRLRCAHGTSTLLEWVAVAVGCILDSMLASGDIGFDLQWQSATIHGSGSEHFAATSLRRVGIVTASIIRNWNKVKNQYLYAASALTSAKEVVACLERSTGSTWSAGYSGVDDCVKEGRSRIERGFPDAGMLLMERSILYDESLDAMRVFQDQDAKGILQLEPENVDSIVREALHSFGHRGQLGCGCV